MEHLAGNPSSGKCNGPTGRMCFSISAPTLTHYNPVDHSRHLPLQLGVSSVFPSVECGPTAGGIWESMERSPSPRPLLSMHCLKQPPALVSSYVLGAIVYTAFSSATAHVFNLLQTKVKENGGGSVRATPSGCPSSGGTAPLLRYKGSYWPFGTKDNCAHG